MHNNTHRNVSIHGLREAPHTNRLLALGILDQLWGARSWISFPLLRVRSREADSYMTSAHDELNIARRV